MADGTIIPNNGGNDSGVFSFMNNMCQLQKRDDGADTECNLSKESTQIETNFERTASSKESHQTMNSGNSSGNVFTGTLTKPVDQDTMMNRDANNTGLNTHSQTMSSSISSFPGNVLVNTINRVIANAWSPVDHSSGGLGASGLGSLISMNGGAGGLTTQGSIGEGSLGRGGSLGSASSNTNSSLGNNGSLGNGALSNSMHQNGNFSNQSGNAFNVFDQNNINTIGSFPCQPDLLSATIATPNSTTSQRSLGFQLLGLQNPNFQQQQRDDGGVQLLVDSSNSNSFNNSAACSMGSNGVPPSMPMSSASSFFPQSYVENAGGNTTMNAGGNGISNAGNYSGPYSNNQSDISSQLLQTLAHSPLVMGGTPLDETNKGDRMDHTPNGGRMDSSYNGGRMDHPPISSRVDHPPNPLTQRNNGGKGGKNMGKKGGRRSDAKSYDNRNDYTSSPPFPRTCNFQYGKGGKGSEYGSQSNYSNNNGSYGNDNSKNKGSYRSGRGSFDVEKGSYISNGDGSYGPNSHNNDSHNNNAAQYSSQKGNKNSTQYSSQKGNYTDHQHYLQKRGRYSQNQNYSRDSQNEENGYDQWKNSYSRQNNTYEQQRTSYDQQRNSYDQQRSSFDQQRNSYDQQRSSYDQQSNHNHQQNRHDHGRFENGQQYNSHNSQQYGYNQKYEQSGTKQSTYYSTDYTATDTTDSLARYRYQSENSMPSRRNFDESTLPANGRYSLQKPMPKGIKGRMRQQQKRYVCCFYIDIDPEDSFVVVKRILGKHGNNMRRVATECESKVRLRGKGSGFLEGPDRKESGDPLQLHVSCVEYENYRRAIEMITRLLEDIYSHYKRHCRQLNLTVPNIEVHMEEMRRDDLMFNLLPQLNKQCNRTAVPQVDVDDWKCGLTTFQ